MTSSEIDAHSELATEGHTTPGSLGAAELQREVASLRVELWAARDAARGAIAEKGTLAARNRELEQLIHQLRIECDRLSQLEHTAAYRLGNVVVKPLKAARARTK